MKKKSYKIDRDFIIPKFRWNDIFSIFLIERKSIYDFLTEIVLKRYGNDIKKEKIMDFGCGSAPYHCLFQSEGYTGVDVKVSGHQKKDIRADVYYDNNLPFLDEEFKYVLATQCLEHIADTDAILKELYRVTKKNGVIFVTVPMVWIDHEQPYDYYRFTEEGIKQKLKENGFRVKYVKKLNGLDDAIAQMRILAFCRKRNFKGLPVKLFIAMENIKYIFRYKKKSVGDRSLSTCIGLIAEK